jgi:AcrR family transcriptional regulator
MATSVFENIRKPQILDAALRIISERGSRDVTLDEIAQAAGLSKGGVVHYFDSKEAIIKEAVREFYGRIFTRGREEMDRYDDPLEKVLSYTWLYNWNDPELKTGYSLLFDFMARAALDDDYRAMFHDWVQNWIHLLSEALTLGVNQGRFHLTDVDGTARIVSAVYQGMATRWYLDRESHSTDWAINAVRAAITRLLSLPL